MGKTVNSLANIRLKTRFSVLVTGAAGFVGAHISAILKCHDDCVLGLDNFNNYYDPTLKGLVKFCWKKVPFSKKDQTDQPTSLYIATKKAGEEITHMYNHIYGLSLTGLRFFTVYGLWGRPDMADYFFTQDNLKRKPIPIFESGNHWTIVRDFTYIDGVVKGCLGALDTTEKSTGSGGKKKGAAQFRIFKFREYFACTCFGSC
ncbi:putative UDP-glucuronate 4-epimerase [Helianthus annuus]|nr:putative UDP-glucuronate 4-epimerase [Helianthus annuus]